MLDRKLQQKFYGKFQLTLKGNKFYTIKFPNIFIIILIEIGVENVNWSFINKFSSSFPDIYVKYALM